MVAASWTFTTVTEMTTVETGLTNLTVVREVSVFLSVVCLSVTVCYATTEVELSVNFSFLTRGHFCKIHKLDSRKVRSKEESATFYLSQAHQSAGTTEK